MNRVEMRTAYQYRKVSITCITPVKRPRRRGSKCDSHLGSSGSALRCLVRVTACATILTACYAAIVNMSNLA